MSEDKSFELPRSLYKEFKKMSREQIQAVLTDIYHQGVASVESTYVDLTDLRKAIGNISGIGEKRLNEIMSVIESFVNSNNTDSE